MRDHNLSYGVIGLALVGLGAIGAVFAGTEMTWPEEDVEVLDGSWATTFESEFDDSFPLLDLAVSFWGRIEFALFEEGRPGVLVGTEGTLFTDEEFRLGPDEEAELARKAALVGEVGRFLAKRDIELLVALLPAKARIERDYLGRYALPPEVEGRYETFQSAVAEQGVAAPDLRGVLEEARETSPVFMRRDTHWTPHGATVVAELLAKASGPVGTTTWVRVDKEPAQHDGDLVRYLPLGDQAEALGYGTERVVPFVAKSEGGGGLGLFDELTLPVAVIGTSYTAGETWSFAQALRIATRADVLNAAQEGMGPVQPMLDYLVNEAFTETPPELVIWELPERFLPVHYDLDDHPALALLEAGDTAE